MSDIVRLSPGLAMTRAFIECDLLALLIKLFVAPLRHQGGILSPAFDAEAGQLALDMMMPEIFHELLRPG